MIVLFQYKGRVYSFDSVDEEILDIEILLEQIKAGTIPDAGLDPNAITAYLRSRKNNPNPRLQ
jgi:hypothetical protein